MPHELVDRNTRMVKLHRAGFTYDEIGAMQVPPISGARAYQIIKRELDKWDKQCPFDRIRDYPGCYEDCPDSDACPQNKLRKVK